MTGSRDGQQPPADSRSAESAGSARAEEEASASSQDREYDGGPTGSGAPPDADGVSRVVTTVNPRIVPAGSRNPAPPAPPPSRTRKAVLAAVAALALVGLSTGWYLLSGGSGADERSGPGVTPGPEWRGGRENDAPGTASPPGPSASEGKGKDDDKKPGDGRSSPSRTDDEDAGEHRPPQNGDGQAPPAPERPPGGSDGGGNGSDGTVQIWNHNSDQCVNVPGGEGRDGTPLEIRTCSGAGSMQWTFAGDGTVRALGLCMDVANGSRENGAVIQLAYCSGNPAQQFRLSEGSDLVNPQADKCVAVRDGNIQSGTPLQLWECTGEDSQKWSPI